MRLALVVSLAALLPLACNNVIVGAQSAPMTVPLRFRGAPSGATVTIDDVRVGSLAVVQARGVRVPAGKHRVSVEADGYLPYDVVVDAVKDPVLVDVSLAQVPD
jgi:hypothetical protein